jgi:hypothetical protein
MKLRHFYPLIGFVIPTIVVAYGFVIPHSCIAGWNAQSIGFGTTLLGACAAYYSGRADRRMWREAGRQTQCGDLTSSLGRVAAQAEYSER